jgi:hypothetical protein
MSIKGVLTYPAIQYTIIWLTTYFHMRDTGETCLQAPKEHGVNSQAKGPGPDGALESPRCGAHGVTRFRSVFSQVKKTETMSFGLCLFFSERISEV